MGDDNDWAEGHVLRTREVKCNAFCNTCLAVTLLVGIGTAIYLKTQLTPNR